MTPAVCSQGLCTLRAGQRSAFCRKHSRLPMRAQKEGTSVVFVPGPVSGALYSQRPSYGARGRVVSVPLGSRRATYLPGPGGGLLYVEWEGLSPSNGSRVCGVSPLDCMRAPAPPRPPREQACDSCRSLGPQSPCGCRKGR